MKAPSFISWLLSQCQWNALKNGQAAHQCRATYRCRVSQPPTDSLSHLPKEWWPRFPVGNTFAPQTQQPSVSACACQSAQAHSQFRALTQCNREHAIHFTDLICLWIVSNRWIIAPSLHFLSSVGAAIDERGHAVPLTWLFVTTFELTELMLP